MTCAYCNSAVIVTESTGGTTNGRFKEVHKCANGHHGWITGDASESPQAWERYGLVFDGGN